MKINADTLVARLGKGLAPVYVLCGDEPLLADEALELIRERAREAGCSERELHIAERYFDWDAFDMALQTGSLFSSRRLIELRLPTGKPGDAGGRFLTTLATRGATDNVVVVVLPALEASSAKSKWAMALAQGAEWVELRPPRRAELPGWLRSRLKRFGLRATDAALDLLAARVEGNLLAAKQEIDKLALLGDGREIDIEAVRDAVSDGARFDMFQLGDAALARDVGRTLRVLHGLQREGEPEVLVLWILTREIMTLTDVIGRIGAGRSIDAAMNEAKVWRSRMELFRHAVRGRSEADAARLVRRVATAEQILKGARRGEAWKALFEVALDLSGATTMAAETA
ncbi:MAG: DNA polymerase III subunit delta [Gammaproteobacteria bacterium]|nr:DNA polymerase III subunit delta [Gammaproteobacteria bacterium]